MIRFLKKYEQSKPKQHPVGMTALYPGGDDRDLYRSSADWVSPHADDNIEDPEPASGTKIVIYDTDHLCGNCGDRHWAWKSFTRGLNPALMDAYDGTAVGLGAATRDVDDSLWDSIRATMGQTLAFSRRIDLAATKPRGDLCSTGYLLASPNRSEPEYLAYLPSGGTAVVDLSRTKGSFWIEWFDVASGRTVAGGAIEGGSPRTFVSPFTSRDAVLYLYSVKGDDSLGRPRR
jgi:hypothetical protein